jgi:iron complex outermembrane receptor protein
MKQNKTNCSHPGILSALSAAIIAFGAHTPALAQDAGNQTTAPTGKTGRSAFDEVVVTARRREESAQSVPIAVNAFSEEKLEYFRATKMEDLKTIAPSLSVSSAVDCIPN